MVRALPPTCPDPARMGDPHVAPTECRECGRKMSASAAVCPHCGTRQAESEPVANVDAASPKPGAPARLGGAQLSKDEVAALLAVTGAPSTHQGRSGPGLFSIALLPHPSTRGVGRAAEIVLTIGSATLVLGGILLLAFSARRVMRFLGARSSFDPEIGGAATTIALGGIGLVASLPFLGLDLGTSAIVAGVCSVATVLRTAIRRAAAPRAPTFV